MLFDSILDILNSYTFIFEQVIHHPGWPLTHHVDEDGLECMICLTATTGCRYESPWPVLEVQYRMTSNLWSSFLMLFSIGLPGRTPMAFRSTLTLTLFTRRPAVLMLPALPSIPRTLLFQVPGSQENVPMSYQLHAPENSPHSRVQLVGISPHFILQYIHVSSCVSKVTRSHSG